MVLMNRGAGTTSAPKDIVTMVGYGDRPFQASESV